MDTQILALQFAKKNGFISVDFQENWNGFDVFIAQPEGDDILSVGYPFFILVKDGLARESEPSEIPKLMHFSEVPSDFTEDLL